MNELTSSTSVRREWSFFGIARRQSFHEQITDILSVMKPCRVFTMKNERQNFGVVQIVR